MVELDKLASGRFDTVFCFGFLYHTIDHMAMLGKIAHLKPVSLIVDTAISTRPGRIIEVRVEEIEHESAAAVGDPGTPARAVSGNPSRARNDAHCGGVPYNPERRASGMSAITGTVIAK